MVFGLTSPSRRSRHTRYTTTTTTSPHRRGGLFHRTNPNRRAAGLKAALHNPNTTREGRREVKWKLRAMGRGNETHVPFSVKLKRFFGIHNHHRRRRQYAY